MTTEAKTFDLNTYQETIRKFYKFSKKDHLTYALLGLSEEVGEVHGVVAKHVRDYSADTVGGLEKGYVAWQEVQDKLKKELGDVYFQITNLIDALGYSVTDIAGMNVAKLEDRLARNVISGSGDAR